MNAKEFLNTALGGNMNFGTLKPLAIEEIMEQYARHKSQETSEADVRLNDLLYGMKLHECTELWKGMEVVRVPGGWIYNSFNENGTGGYDQTCCFVPFNSEFKEAV